MNEENFVTLSWSRLEHMLQSAAHMGAITAMQLAGVPTKDNFTRAEMCRMHGRGKVNRLIKSGALEPKTDSVSGKTYYSEFQFQSLLV